MKDLEKLYNDAPKFESPTALDQRILRVAESRQRVRAAEEQAEAVRLNPKWRVAAFAVSTVGVFAIGLGVLLESGMVGNRGGDDPLADNSIVASAESARSGVSIRRTDAVLVEPTQLESSQVVHETRDLVEEVPLVSETRLAKTERVAGDEQPMSLATDDIAVVPDTSQSDSSPGNMVAESASVSSAQATSAETASIEVAQAEVAIEEISIAVPDAGDLAGADTASRADVVIAAAPESIEPQAGERARSASVAGFAAQKSPQVTNPEGSVSGNKSASNFSRQSGNARATQIRSSDWLLKQNQSDYTVQLAPAGDRATLFIIADNISLATDQLRAGSVSWLLLHGRFTDRASAELAIVEIIESVAELPQVSALIKPKVVSFGELRQSLR